ncbi:MAG: cyclic nucleotide-binding/CBS domain-containing protein [Holosporaceae bacterium]|jgi:CBS domain-containing protein
MLVKNLLCQEKNVVSIDVGDSVYTACHRMTENNVSMLVVVNGSEVAGLFSEHDLATNVLDRNLDPRKTMVCTVMSPIVVAVSPHDTIDHALGLLERHRLHHLLVVDNGRVLDILSIRQIYSLVNQALATDLNHMRSYIGGDYSVPLPQ